MIKIISNLTTTQKISVESKFVTGNSSDSTSKSKSVYSDTLLFVKLTFSGLKLTDKIGKVNFGVIYDSCVNTHVLKLYPCTSSNNSDISALTSTGKAQEIAYIYGHDNSLNFQSSPQRFVSFDITNLVKAVSDNQTSFSVMFAISNDNNSSNPFNLYSPQSESVEICSATISEVDGINNIYKYEDRKVGSCGTGKINLFTGKLLFGYEGLKSLSKKMPVAFSALFNQNSLNELGKLGYGWKAPFEYKYSVNGEKIILTDSSGNQNNFSKITDDEADSLSIDKDKVVGDIYYTSIDHSYLFKNTIDSDTSITLFDKVGNQAIFDVSSTNFIKITSTNNVNKQGLTYTWSGNKLESIKSSDGDELFIAYDSTGKIVQVDFTNEFRRIKFDYINNFLSTIQVYKWENKSNEQLETLLASAKYEYDGNNNLYKVTDIMTKVGCEFTYTNSKVSKTQYFIRDSIETGAYTNFFYNDRFTEVSDYEGNNLYHYFDNYGRCRQIIDKEGKSISYNYDEYENGESKNLIGKSNVQINERNLIENHSFDSNDNPFNSDTTAWILSGAKNSIVKPVYGGVYGEKCLMIDIAADEIITISQDIINPSTGSYILEGFLKHIAKTNNTVSSGEILIDLYTKYTIEEQIPITTDTSSGTVITGYQSQVVDKEIEKSFINLSGNKDWYKFTVPQISIPTGAYDISMMVTIIIKGTGKEVFIDDLQLSQGDHKIRYNYIENGYLEFIEGNKPKGWDFNSEVLTIDGMTQEGITPEHSSVLGDHVMRFTAQGMKLHSIITTQLLYRQMSKTIKMNGLAGENLIFSVFAKALTSNSNIFLAYMKLFSEGVELKEYTFDFEKNFSKWQLLTRSISAEYPFDQVEVGVRYSGGSEAYFDAFQLYKDTYGSFYNYDEKNNLVEVMNSDNSSLIKYDDDNFVNEVIGQDGSCYRYEYNDDKQLIAVYDISNNKVSFSYDGNDNVIESSIRTADGSTLTTHQEFDDNNNPTTLTDERGLKTIQKFDTRNRLTEVDAPNELILNSTYSDYDELLTLLTNVQDKSIGNVCTYTNDGQISTMSCENGSLYSFDYDNWGRVTTIKVNNEIYGSLEYKKFRNNVNTGLVTKQTYGSGTLAKSYSFGYDSKDRLTSVSYDNALVVSYEYDQNGNVSYVNDRSNNIEKYFSYDDKGKLVKQTTSQDKQIEYLYDNLNNIQKVTYDINDVKRSYDYEYKYEFNEYSKEGYFNRLEKVFGDETIKGGMRAKGTYGAKPIFRTYSGSYDSEINMSTYKFDDKYQLIWYDLSTFNASKTSGYSNGQPFNLPKWKQLFLYKKTFYAWIKPTGTFDEENIFKFQNVYTDENSLEVHDALCGLVITTDGKLGYKIDGTNATAITSNTLTKDVWNLVGIQFVKKGTVMQYRIILNDECTNFVDANVDPTFINHLIVSDQSDYLPETASTSSATTGTNNDLSLPFSICFISAGAFSYQSEDFKAIYNEGIKYLSKSAPLPSSGVLYYNHELYKDFDVITLNGSLVSSYGVEPEEYIETDPSFKIDKAKIFKYDEILKKHVYGSYSAVSNLTPGNKSLLSYDLNMRTSGTQSIRFRLDDIDVTNNKYILANVTNGVEKLSAFVTSSNVLRFIVNGTIVSSLDIANLATDWHDLTISYNQSTITIVLDKTIVRQVNLAVDLTASITYIGCIKVSGTAVNHLEGLIEMFAYSDISLVEADIKTLQENGKAIISRTKYDALGRNVEKQILVGDNELKTQYSYLSTTGNNTTTLVETETLPNGNIITYDYDNSNNIKSKIETTATGTFVSKVEYVYDELDRLLTEITYSSSKTTTESFTYDQNNNIDTHQIKDGDITTVNEQYIYDTVVKDRLISIKDLLQDTTVMSLEYEDAYKGNPTKIIKDGVTNTLAWQGRRLTNLNDNSYFYDENGIRIKKITANDTTLYDLEGDRVIGLTKNIFYGDSVKLVFHYNEANQLIGLSMNGEEYFYERDITGNINKIIDKDNTIMVKYTYDAWGNPKIIDEAQTTISSLLATHNPFLYKGYIYDAETGYYYLNSRYYDPELRRFINADGQIEQPGDVLGHNMYAYCKNNPVMMFDPSGFLPQWAKWTIGGVVLGVLAVATVLTLGAAAPITGLAATLVTGAFIGSSISAGVGMGIAALTGGDLADAFMWGSITGGVAGAASAGLGEVAFASSKLATAGLQVAGNTLISGGITAIQGLATNSFSWKDVGTSSAFGAIGGGVGVKLNGTSWENGIRGFVVASGLGMVQGGVSIIIDNYMNEITETIRNTVTRPIHPLLPYGI